MSGLNFYGDYIVAECDDVGKTPKADFAGRAQARKAGSGTSTQAWNHYTYVSGLAFTDGNFASRPPVKTGGSVQQLKRRQQWCPKGSGDAGVDDGGTDRAPQASIDTGYWGMGFFPDLFSSPPSAPLVFAHPHGLNGSAAAVTGAGPLHSPSSSSTSLHSSLTYLMDVPPIKSPRLPNTGVGDGQQPTRSQTVPAQVLQQNRLSKWKNPLSGFAWAASQQSEMLSSSQHSSESSNNGTASTVQVTERRALSAEGSDWDCRSTGVQDSYGWVNGLDTRLSHSSFFSEVSHLRPFALCGKEKAASDTASTGSAENAADCNGVGMFLVDRLEGGDGTEDNATMEGSASFEWWEKSSVTDTGMEDAVALMGEIDAMPALSGLKQRAASPPAHNKEAEGSSSDADESVAFFFQDYFSSGASVGPIFALDGHPSSPGPRPSSKTGAKGKSLPYPDGTGAEFQDTEDVTRTDAGECLARERPDHPSTVFSSIASKNTLRSSGLRVRRRVVSRVNMTVLPDFNGVETHASGHSRFLVDDSSSNNNLSNKNQTIPEMLRWTAPSFSEVLPYAVLVSLPAEAESVSSRGSSGNGARKDADESNAASKSNAFREALECLKKEIGFTEQLHTQASSDPVSSKVVYSLGNTVANGHAVSIASLHARCEKPAHFSSWASCLPLFFQSFFRCMELNGLTEHMFSVNLSVAVVRQDLYRDLLSDAALYCPVVVVGSPLLGVRLQHTEVRSASSPETCLAILGEAHRRLSLDDFLSGSVVVNMVVKQQLLDRFSGVLKDILLSSMTFMASNAVVYGDAMQADRLPLTTGLLNQLFHGPVQPAVFLDARNMSTNPEELYRALVVQRVLRNCRTLRPPNGSLRKLLLHIRDELHRFSSVLNASKQRAADQRRTFIAKAASLREQECCNGVQEGQRHEGGRILTSPTAHPELSEMDEKFRMEYRQRERLGRALRTLTLLGLNCKAALSAPVSELPPAYVLGWQRRMQGSTECREEPRGLMYETEDEERILPRGSSDLHLGRHSSSINASPLPGSAGVKYPPGAYGGGGHDSDSRPVTPNTALRRWATNVPEPNMFAGDAACAVRGLRPLFCTADARLQKAFDVDGDVVEMRPVETVVYLDDEGRDKVGSIGGHSHLQPAVTEACGPSPRPAFRINDYVTGGTKRPGSAVCRFMVDELCLYGAPASSTTSASATQRARALRSDTVKRGGGTTCRKPDGVASPLFSGKPSAVSSTVKSAFDDFLNGYNISIFGVCGPNGEEEVLTRILRCPLWGAMQEMVEEMLRGGSTSESDGRTTQTLYMSVTQPLSVYSVRDHLYSTADVSSTESADVGVHAFDTCRPSRSSPNSAIKFEVAWTPAGPVVAGAKFIPVRSLSQFLDVVAELPSRLRNSHDAGVDANPHLLVSFLLRKEVPKGKSSPTQRDLGSSPREKDVWLTSATVLLSSDAMFWNSLHCNHFVSASYPQNLFTPYYRHRIITVLDVSSSSSHAAVNLLTAQHNLHRRVHFPLWQARWSMRAYVLYLRLHLTDLRWCIGTLSKQKSSSNGSVSVDWTGLGAPQTARFVFASRSISINDVVAAWLQVELMRGIALDLVGESPAPLSHPGATSHCEFTDVCPKGLMEVKLMYNITSPIRHSTFTMQLLEAEEDGSERVGMDTRATAALCSTVAPTVQEERREKSKREAACQDAAPSKDPEAMAPLSSLNDARPAAAHAKGTTGAKEKRQAQLSFRVGGGSTVQDGPTGKRNEDVAHFLQSLHAEGLRVKPMPLESSVMANIPPLSSHSTPRLTAVGSLFRTETPSRSPGYSGFTFPVSDELREFAFPQKCSSFLLRVSDAPVAMGGKVATAPSRANQPSGSPGRNSGTMRRGIAEEDYSIFGRAWVAPS